MNQMIKKLLLVTVSYLAVSLAVTKAIAVDTDNKLNIYVSTWTLDQSSKMSVFKVFSGMTAEDDAALEKKYGVHFLGRWSSISDGTGFGVIEASSVEAVYAFAMNWVPTMSIKVIPVLNDADTRKVISAYFADQNAKK